MSCIIEAEARKGLEAEAALVDLLLLRYYCHRARCSKIGKKCNFKSTKTHFELFQNGKKSIFAQEKTTKNAIFGLFSGAKIDFLPFLK